MSHASAAVWTSVFTNPHTVLAKSSDDAGETGSARDGGRSLGNAEAAGVGGCQADIGGTSVPELLARLRAGQVAAFDALYHELFRVLWTLAVLQTHSGETAEEIVHDVFFRLWNGRETLHIEGDLRVYLAAAVRNAARNVHRHAKVVDAFETSVAATATELPVTGQSAMAPDVAVEQGDFLAAYRRALMTLTEQERTAAFLRWEEGWPYERIGGVMSLSKKGAHKVVQRAQSKVQILLASFRK